MINLLSSFLLIEKKQKIPEGAGKTTNKHSILSFVLTQKKQKVKTANKFLKLFSIPPKKNNSPDKVGFKQIFLFNAPFRHSGQVQIILLRNLFEVKEKQWEVKLFNAILFMCENNGIYLEQGKRFFAALRMTEK
jgi:hypothetical protein